MPDETNDQLGNEGAYESAFDQQKDGSEVPETEDQGMDGQVSEQSAEDADDDGSKAEAATIPEEEPVGSKRPGPRTFKKMSASDFKVKPKPEPKPEPVPEPKPEKTEPIPAREPAVAPERPKPEPRREPVPQPRPIPSSRPPEHAAEPEHKPEPKPEPEPEQVRSPVQEEPAQRPVAEEEPPIAEPPPRRPREEEDIHEPHEPKGAGLSSGGIMSAIKSSLSFFTLIPIKVDDEEIKAMDKNMFIIPFVGLIIGIVASIIGLVFDGLRAGAMVSIAVLASVYIMSKFLHFDGLADFGDGMIAGGDREGRIRALKDTRIGAGGLGVVLVVVLATIAAYNGIWTAFMLAAVVVIAEVFVKNAMVAAAAFGEPGNGMASEQVRNTNTSTLLLSTILSAGLAFAGYLIMGLIVSIVNTNGMWSTVPLVSAVILIAGAAVSSIFVGWLIAYLSNKKFGFVNGDVLGATNEISRVLILFVALLIVQFYTIPEWPGWIMGFF